MTDSPEVSAAVVILDRHVLLVRRRVPEGKLRWQFPAGKVLPGELLAVAAEREAREETGVQVGAMRFLGERVHPRTGRTIVYIACQAVSGIVRVAAPEEIAEVFWCPVADLPQWIPEGVFWPVQQYLDECVAWRA